MDTVVKSMLEEEEEEKRLSTESTDSFPFVLDLDMSGDEETTPPPQRTRRIRGPNFTYEETLHLCVLWEKYKDVIENRKTDVLSVQEKNEAWSSLAAEYNATVTGPARNADALKACYKNRKALVRKLQMEEKNKSEETDPLASGDDILEKIKSTLTTTDRLYTRNGDDTPLRESHTDKTVERNISLEDNLTISSSGKNNHVYARSHLKRKYQPAFTNGDTFRKQTTSNNFIKRPFKKIPVTGTFGNLEDDNEMVNVQKKLIAVQVDRQRILLEKERVLKRMEIEEMKRKHDHNKIVREMEIEELQRKFEHNQKMREQEQQLFNLKNTIYKDAINEIDD